MNKKIVIHVLAIIFLLVNASGCIDTKSPKTQSLINDLPEINENMEISLGNINTHLYNFNLEYKWSVLMNYLTITDSMLNEMKDYEDKIKDELTYLSNISSDYQQMKNEANLNELENKDINLKNEIDEKIESYNDNISDVNSCLDNMSTYRNFVSLVAQRVTLLEDYEGILTLMNSRVENEEYEKARNSTDELIQIFSELKNISQDAANLNVMYYSPEILGIWDMYIDSWEIYGEYLNLLIQKRYSQADSKYSEYSNLYNDIMEIENTDNINENNNVIDEWYSNHIGVYLNLFEEYS